MPSRLTICVVGLVGLLPFQVLAASLAGTEWKPVRMGAVEVPEASSAYVQFRSKGRLTGHSGCNRLQARYVAEDGSIFIGPVAATRMVCADTVMTREVALAAALERSRTFRRRQAELVLYDAGGQPILELRQTDWD